MAIFFLVMVGVLIMSFSLFFMLLDTIFDKEIFDKLSQICVLLGAVITFPTMLIFFMFLCCMIVYIFGQTAERTYENE